MTNTEVVKALRCCAVHPMVCKECPYMGIECCTNAHRKDALDLINRQNQKIKDLEVSLQAMRNVANGYKSAYERAEGARNTAIQDFAERLKECTYDGGSHPTVWDEFACAVDNLVKEMTGEQE